MSFPVKYKELNEIQNNFKVCDKSQDMRSNQWLRCNASNRVINTTLLSLFWDRVISTKINHDHSTPFSA